MTNLEKMNEMLINNPELQQKIDTEIKRFAKTKETDDPKKIFASTAKSVLDIDFSEEEVNEIFSKVRPLSPEELEQASGGGIAGAVVFSAAGALAGTYVGSAFGPVGGVIGGCIGAVGGGAFGYYLWEDNL